MLWARMLAVVRSLKQAEREAQKQSTRLQAGLLVAEVLSLERHPKADRLQVAVLNVGRSPVRVRWVDLPAALHQVWTATPSLLTVARHVCRWLPTR